MRELLVVCDNCHYVKVWPAEGVLFAGWCHTCKKDTNHRSLYAAQEIKQQEGSIREHQEGDGGREAAKASSSNRTQRAEESKEEEIEITRIIVRTLRSLEEHFQGKLVRLTRN